MTLALGFGFIARMTPGNLGNPFLWFIIKGCNSGWPDGRDAEGKVWGKGWGSVPVSECPPRHLLPTQKSSSFVFHGGFRTQAQLIKSLVICD